MRQFKIGENEFNVITEWNELSLNQYLRISDLEKEKTNFFSDEEYMMNVLEILCDVNSGELDDLLIDDLAELINSIQMLKEKPVWNQKNHFEIDGVTYILKKDMNKLTTGEYISIKTIQERYKGNDMIPYLLTVVVRPGKVEVDPETGREIYIADKYNSKNMEARKNLLLEKCKAVDLVGMVDFFLTGNE